MINISCFLSHAQLKHASRIEQKKKKKKLYFAQDGVPLNSDLRTYPCVVSVDDSKSPGRTVRGGRVPLECTFPVQKCA